MPNVPPRQTTLHQEAARLAGAGRLAEAESAYRALLANNPADAAALHGLGMVALSVGQPAPALTLVEKAAALRPDDPDIAAGFGLLLAINRRLSDAERVLRDCLAANPNRIDVRETWANVLLEMDQPSTARGEYEQILAQAPNNLRARYNYAVALKHTGENARAIIELRRVLAKTPNDVAALNNLGVALLDEGKAAEAVTALRKATTLAPDDFEMRGNLGLALAVNDMEAAEVIFRELLAKMPASREISNRLAALYSNSFRVGDAIALYRATLTRSPDDLQVLSALVHSLNYISPGDNSEIYTATVAAVKPLEMAVTTHRGHQRAPHEKIRVGYVSADLIDHPVGRFFEPLIAHHDKTAFDIYCYANSTRFDSVSERLRAHATAWRTIADKSDTEVIEDIERDEIDILVDLSGHTTGNRLSVFWCRAAPVQITWLGSPNTTGISTMDYRFTDAVADPEGEADAQHSERLIRLPNGFLAYRPPVGTPECVEPPLLKTGVPTFGSFNNIAKLSPETIALWSVLLKRVPTARLLLKAAPFRDPSVARRAQALFAAEGVAPERLEFMGPIDAAAGHLAAYGRLDVALDPFPYNGTTTTCESLWMGVPVVTLSGKRHAARVGTTLLTRVGLEELIAHDNDSYIEIAATLAQDSSRLRELRQTLRQRLMASPLMDEVGFARSVESAYRAVLKETEHKGKRRS